MRASTKLDLAIATILALAVIGIVVSILAIGSVLKALGLLS